MSRNLLVAIGVVILIAIAGGYFYLQNQGSQTPTPSPVSEDLPNESVTPSLESTASGTPDAMTQDEEASVSATQNGFVPQTLNIKAGTKVVWNNNSGGLADVESTPHPTHTSWPFLNLGTFANGGSVSVVFDKPGTYTYHNHLTPSQKGSVIVE